MKIRSKMIACLALLLVIGLMKEIQAEPPAKSMRMFFVLTPVDSTQGTYDQTPGLILVDEMTGGSQVFGTTDDGLQWEDEDFQVLDHEGNLIDLQGTVWTNHKLIVASSEDGLYRGASFLIYESEDFVPPADGALTTTGKNGDVVHIASAYATKNTSGAATGKWSFVSTAGAADYRMDIYLGLFTK